VKLALYGHPFSSYTWKALIPLYANDTPFEFREVSPMAGEEINGFVQSAHPAGKFPILRDGDTTVIEATSIIEYLALNHPGPSPLIPADPTEAATARMMDRVFDNYVMGALQDLVSAYLSFTGPNRTPVVIEPDMARAEEDKARLRRAYAWIEKWLGDNELPAHVSLVSCAAAPSLFYADWVEDITDEYPRLKALRAELLALPSVARCVDDARPYRAYFPPGAPDRD